MQKIIAILCWEAIIYWANVCCHKCWIVTSSASGKKIIMKVESETTVHPNVP